MKGSDFILFNIELFNAWARKAYSKAEGDLYPLEESLEIFRYYFQKYEDTFHEPHPNIRMAQITSIIGKMSFVADDTLQGRILDIVAEDYQELINQHFKKQQKCDYNINHFFSGNVRLLRFYEAVY